jgi:thiol-disulfide isomerase/thioredoxin
MSSSGCWYIKFYADWCGACKANIPKWKAASNHKPLRYGCRFAEVNVDKNRALTEAFGVRSIPQFFVAKEARVSKLDAKVGFSTESLVAFREHLDSHPEDFQSGLLDNPLGLGYTALIHVGYWVEDYANLLKERFGLDATKQIVAVVGTAIVIMLIWALMLYWCLGYCFPMPQEPAAKTAKKAKKD